MENNSFVHDDLVVLAGALWKVLQRDHADDLQRFVKSLAAEEMRHGPGSSPEQNARFGDGAIHLPKTQQEELALNSQMKIVTFIENKFVPEHVAFKRSSGQAHYKSMLKHVIGPDEVQRIFPGKDNGPRMRLEAVPGWPYLTDVRLCDARPEHVSRLASAALAHGYSIQTVKHIRNVISAVFSHARKEQYFAGDNPVSRVRPPHARRNQSNPLTLPQAKQALGAMQYPEREITLFGVFTGMNLAEILGLQWKHVNLTEVEILVDGVRIPPMSIAVGNQLFRGYLEAAKQNRVRNLEIPYPLKQMLLRLRLNAKFVGPDDFVFASHAGTPINQNNIMTRRIRPLARQLGVASLSWQAFRRFRNTLLSQDERKMWEFTCLALDSVSS
jgi:integrase